MERALLWLPAPKSVSLAWASQRTAASASTARGKRTLFSR